MIIGSCFSGRGDCVRCSGKIIISLDLAMGLLPLCLRVVRLLVITISSCPDDQSKVRKIKHY